MKANQIKDKVLKFMSAFKSQKPLEVDFILRGTSLRYGQVMDSLKVLRSDGIVNRTSKQHNKWEVR